jgi:predicted lipoprotein with Yx(FWY)xxD motif
MQKLATARGGLLLTAALFVGLIAAFYATRSSASSGPRLRVVMTAKNKALGKTILVTTKGLSLYSLSVERNGRFMCTNSSCLSVWKPLTVAKGATPTGTSRLGTVKRPNGTTQVTYRGGPLYRFVQDHKRGDVKGNGFKDVGTWHVIIVGGAAGQPAASPPPTYTYPRGY